LIAGGIVAATVIVVPRLVRRALAPERTSTIDAEEERSSEEAAAEDKPRSPARKTRPLQPEEGPSRYLRREATPVVLLLVGVAAIAATFLAHDVTWRAIWIGVASTTVSAGLVDSSALLEFRRRDRAVLRVAGDRVGAARALFMMVIDAMLGGVSDIEHFSARGLREVKEAVSIDLDEDSHMMPPRSRRVQVTYMTQQMTDALHEALRLGSQTSEALRFEEIDSGMRRNGFVLYLHSVIAQGFQFDPLPPRYIHSAADALDLLEKHLEFFRHVAGDSWQYPAAEAEG